MYSPINEKLEKTRQDVYRLHKNNSMLSILKNELKESEENERKLKERLDKENRDFEKLQEKNISSLFYTVFGRLESKTAEEQKEVLAAKLHYDQCLADLEDIRRQISELELDNLKYADSEDEFDILYKGKVRLLMAENGETAQKIADLEERIEDNKNNLKEIHEAVLAGYDVLECLEKVSNSLNRAEGWGYADILAGGIIITGVKRSHINDAGRTVPEAQHLLRKFNTELADVHVTKDVQIQTGSFSAFADYFFDGLISDFYVQNQISQSQNSVRDVQTQVQNALNALETLKKSEQDILTKLNEELKQTILGA